MGCTVRPLQIGGFVCIYATLLLLVAESSTTASSEKQVFKNNAGTIVSPNYPKHYNNYDHRDYEIVASTPSEILLVFRSFDVEEASDCSYDYLKVSAFQVQWWPSPGLVLVYTSIHTLAPHQAARRGIGRLNLLCMFREWSIDHSLTVLNVP